MKIEHLKEVNINPKLFISEEIYSYLLQQIRTTQREVTFVLHIEKESDDLYKVVAPYYPPQWNEPAETKTLDSEYPNWCYELTKSNVRLNGHLHTHPNFSTNPSGYDITFFNNLIEDTNTYQFRFIMNHKGLINCDLIDRINQLVFYEVPVIVPCKGFNLIINNNLKKLEITNQNDIVIDNIDQFFNITLKSNELLINTQTKDINFTKPIPKNEYIKITPRNETDEAIGFGRLGTSSKYVQTSLFPDAAYEELDDYIYNHEDEIWGSHS